LLKLHLKNGGTLHKIIQTLAYTSSRIDSKLREIILMHDKMRKKGTCSLRSSRPLRCGSHKDDGFSFGHISVQIISAIMPITVDGRVRLATSNI